MKKKILVSLVMVISLLICGGGIGYAKVTGRCDNCHTMHNSQGGADLDASGPYEQLLTGDCVGCHSHATSTSYTLGTSTVPVVYTTGSAPTTYLAGGNFHWVAQAGGDAKGHNVLGIAGQDGAITATEGAPGNPYNCGNSCHKTLAVAQTADTSLGSGCQGCHLNVMHHANDGTGTKYVGTADKGWYRFLSGHQSGTNKGVAGIEHNEWGPSNGNVGGTDHNEYLGKAGTKTAVGSLANLGNTMTGYCCGCHGNFHEEQNASGAWIRHPSDHVIPNTGEYASMYTAYNPTVPVARDASTMSTLGNNPSGTTTAGTDMVMCLSCHRPHGTPFDDLLRWNYADMIAGDTSKSGGCFVCHTAKND